MTSKQQKDDPCILLWASAKNITFHLWHPTLYCKWNQNSMTVFISKDGKEMSAKARIALVELHDIFTSRYKNSTMKGLSTCIWAVTQENTMHHQWSVSWTILKQKDLNEGGLVQRGGNEITRDSDRQDGRCKDKEELRKSYFKTKTALLSLWSLHYRKPGQG